MTPSHGGQSDWQRRQQAAARDAERRHKEELRARANAEKQREQARREERAAKVARKNVRLNETVDELREFLRRGLGRPARIDLERDRRTLKVEPINLEGIADPVPQPRWEDFKPAEPTALSRMVGGAARYERRAAEAKEKFQEAERRAKQAEEARLRQVNSAQVEYAARLARERDEVKKHNTALDQYIRAIGDREPASVEKYLLRVLQAVPLPGNFPRIAEVSFSRRTEQAVVRFELPPPAVVPTVAAYKYLPTKNEERETPRSRSDVAEIYRSAISQTALLCLRDLFDADPELNSVGFNGHAHTINPATGEQEYPCFISLNVERAAFPRDENLRNVTAEKCVRHLRAIVSNHPYEFEPIEPILDFDLTRFSFVEGLDAVSTLDSRPDLMDMSYTNFEHLVRQIFEAQGAEGWTTQQSNDDGVDAVIVQRRALMGGLTIVQAKHYSKVIGVSHVRELAGAMEEKKAGWGILITTSWFTSNCWDKARDHGRMELIDGERLIYLIKEYLGKDVLIGIPNRPRPRPNP